MTLRARHAADADSVDETRDSMSPIRPRDIACNTLPCSFTRKGLLPPVARKAHQRFAGQGVSAGFSQQVGSCLGTHDSILRFEVTRPAGADARLGRCKWRGGWGGPCHRVHGMHGMIRGFQKAVDGCGALILFPPIFLDKYAVLPCMR